MEADTDDNEVKNVSTPIVTEFKTKPINMSPSASIAAQATPSLDEAENDLLKQQYTLRTCDSGFSEWTDSASMASLNETPRLRDLSPIYSTPSNSEADSLAHSSSLEFQRNHRRSWPLKSRKLSFVSSDDIASPESTLQLKLEDEGHGFSHSVQNLVSVVCNDGADNKFISGSVGKSDLLDRVLHRSRSCSRSPLYSSSEELESSFHEMSLEDSSSSSDSAPSSPHSPINISSSSPVFSFKSLHKSHKAVSKQSAMTPHFPSKLSISNCIPSIGSQEANTCQNSNESSVCLSRVTFLPDEKASVKDEADKCSSAPSIQISHLPILDTTSHSPASLQGLSSHSPVDSINFTTEIHPSVVVPRTPMTLEPSNLNSHNHRSNLVSDINYLSLLPSNSPNIKSPSKRSNVSQVSCSDSVSPLKQRRLQKGSISVLDIDASRRNLFGCRKEFDSLQSEKRGGNYHRVGICSTDDRMPKFMNIDSASTLCDDVQIKERSEGSDASLVQRICHVFSPSCPSQLIGRHVGVKTFDIVAGLEQHNLFGCVEMVLSYIPDCDLVKFVEVSETWKSALYNETKSLRRYKNLLRKQNSPRKCRNQACKENMTEKRLKDNVLMTASSGLLASIQPQTMVRTDIPHPTVPSSQHPDLQCGDLVRNCPHCQSRAIVQPAQERAICLSEKCSYDFCTKCFFPFHHSTPCKPLFLSASKTTLAGTKKSKKNLKRLKTL